MSRQQYVNCALYHYRGNHTFSPTCWCVEYETLVLKAVVSDIRGENEA